jgi:excisionase family DNA binding protein
MDSEFYSIKELAVVLNVHINTVRRAIKKGHLIAIRIGDTKRSPYRISKKSIEAIHESIIREFARKAKK